MTKAIAYTLLIDGERVAASDSAAFDSFNPTTGEIWATVPEGTESDVNRAAQATNRAFKQGPWPAMSPTERGHYLRRLAALLVAKSENQGTIDTKDTGKLLKETHLKPKDMAYFFIFQRFC